MILAAGVAWGTHAWLASKSIQSEQTATLSWDAAVARHMDPSLADATEPALATAQSVLNDAVVASLAQPARLTSSGGAARIGEFRSRLELRQTSSDQLQVGFRDPSPERAVATANRVAEFLATGTSGLPTTAATSEPAPSAPAAARAPQAVPQAPPKTSAASAGSGALAHSLEQLESELSATESKVDGLSSTAWQRREHPELSSYRESKEQQLLTAEVGSALKEIADLRGNSANGPAQEPLRQIQDALRSVWPASRADKTARGPADYSGFNAAGVNAGRLRLEREEFAHAVEVVQKSQRAVQRMEPEPTATPEPQPTESAPAAPPVAAQSAQAPAAAPAASPSSSVPIAESEIPQPPAEVPFHLLRSAGTPARNPLWPPIVGGACCALLYLMIAGSRYRQDEEEEEFTEESFADSQRMITPAKPMRPANFFESSDPRPPDSGETAEPRSSSFFESAPPRSTDSSERVEPPPAEIVLPRPQIEPPDLPGSSRDERSSDVRVQEITVNADETKRPFRESGVSEERAADPWVDNIMKSLSATSIGRMYEKPASADRQGDPKVVDGQGLSIHSDRLAG